MIPFASAPWPLKAAYLSLLLVSAAAGVTALTAIIALAGLHRLSMHLHLSAAPAWFWYFRGDPAVRRWLAIGGLSSLTVTGLLILAAARARPPPLHGAARWASESELVRAGLRAVDGILLGRRNGRPLVFGGQEHVLLYAPTRSGKGVGVVIPNLLSWAHSVVVLDVKRENWDATAGFRAAHGQRVLLFDPLEPEGRTLRFNPLDHIDRTDPTVVVDELQRIAVMLFPAPPNADPFWAEAARTGFIGVGGLVAARDDLPFSLGAIYRELTAGDPRLRLPQMVEAEALRGESLPAVYASAITDFCSASENTFASIRQTITSRMSLWLNPRVCAATDVSDFDLRDLRNVKMSLYLTVSPDNLARVAPLYNLLLQQLVDLNTRERPSPGRHETPVLVLLDEFARLGHAAVLARAFAYVAGYGLRLLPVLQSPAQLRAEYGPDLAEEIIANCGVEIAFAPKELKVAQELSDRLGFYTASGLSRSRPSGLSSGRRSQTDSPNRRALMLPQELLQMPADRLIVLRAGLPPVRGAKIVYWRERVFTRRQQPAPEVASLARVAGLSSTGKPQRAPASSPPVGGVQAPPPEGASVEQVEAWVLRYIDAAATLPNGVDHGR